MTAARAWVSYGPEQKITATSTAPATIPQDGSTLTLTLGVTPASPSVAETVYVYLDVDHSARGDLEIILISPSGTESLLIPGPRPETSTGASTRNTPVCSASNDSCQSADDGVCDYAKCGCDYNDCGGDAMLYDYGPSMWNWKMATVRNWGENSAGTWTLQIKDKRTTNTHTTAIVNQWSVFVYGHAGYAAPLSPPSPSPPSPVVEMASPFPPFPPSLPFPTSSTEASTDESVQSVSGVTYVTTFTLVVAGSVETFDKTAFKAKLATVLKVAESLLVVTVSAASVKVMAQLTTDDESISTSVAQTVEQFRSNPSALSASLGVQVESVTRPVTTSPQQDSAGSATGAIIGGSVGGVVLLAAVAAGVVLYLRKKSNLSKPATSVTVTHNNPGGDVSMMSSGSARADDKI